MAKNVSTESQSESDSTGGSSGLTEAEIRTFRHDARNQLNLIIGYIDLMSRPSAGELTTKQLMFLDRVRGAAQNLESMLDNLLPRSDGGDQAA